MVHKEAGESVHIFLVGGKSDLKDKRATTLEVLSIDCIMCRELTCSCAQVVKAYATEQHIAYIEASALSGENVAQLFMLVGKKILDTRELLAAKHAAEKPNLLDEPAPSRRSLCCRG